MGGVAAPATTVPAGPVQPSSSEMGVLSFAMLLCVSLLVGVIGVLYLRSFCTREPAANSNLRDPLPQAQYRLHEEANFYGQD